MNKIRMLLSYNFAITETDLLPFDRQEFVNFFGVKLNNSDSQIEYRSLNNPHWILEILFPKETFDPSEIGKMCAQFLADKRQKELSESAKMHDILILGGIKTTPSSNTSPDSLKTGQWGVDLVETTSAREFLETISWEIKTATKKDSTFKIEIKG